jgi:hypothetical protein
MQKGDHGMSYRKTITEIARRLPHRSRCEVAEVLDVLRDLWLAELVQPCKTITLFDLGTLSIEVQELQTAGAVRQTLQDKWGDEYPDLIQRIYGRFRPSAILRRALAETRREVFDE